MIGAIIYRDDMKRRHIWRGHDVITDAGVEAAGEQGE